MLHLHHLCAQAIADAAVKAASRGPNPSCPVATGQQPETPGDPPLASAVEPELSADSGPAPATAASSGSSSSDSDDDMPVTETSDVVAPTVAAAPVAVRNDPPPASAAVSVMPPSSSSNVRSREGEEAMLNEDLQENKRLCIGAVAVDEAPDDLICSCESSLAMKAATFFFL